jgi:hypothetical protein
LMDNAVVVRRRSKSVLGLGSESWAEVPRSEDEERPRRLTLANRGFLPLPLPGSTTFVTRLGQARTGMAGCSDFRSASTTIMTDVPNAVCRSSGYHESPDEGTSPALGQSRPLCSGLVILGAVKTKSYLYRRALSWTRRLEGPTS